MVLSIKFSSIKFSLIQTINWPYFFFIIFDQVHSINKISSDIIIVENYEKSFDSNIYLYGGYSFSSSIKLEWFHLNKSKFVNGGNVWRRKVEWPISLAARESHFDSSFFLKKTINNRQRCHHTFDRAKAHFKETKKSNPHDFFPSFCLSFLQNAF